MSENLTARRGVAVLVALAWASDFTAAQTSVPASDTQPVRLSVVVAGFEPAADCDPRDAWLATAAEETLAWRLRRCGAFTVVPVVRAYQARSELAAGNEQPLSWIDAARPLGAALLISGQGGGPPDSMNLTLTCTWLDAGRAAETHTVGPGRLPEVLDLATRWVAERGGVTIATPQAELVFAPPARLLSAIEYHARAVMALRGGDLRGAMYYASESFGFDPRYRPTIALLGQLELRLNPQRAREAVPRLRLLAALARDAGDDHDRADAELELALIDMLSGAREAAGVRFETALALFESTDDAYGRLGALAQIVEWHVSDPANATAAVADGTSAPATQPAGLRRACELQAMVVAGAAALGDLLAEAPATNKLALLYERLGERDRALELQRRTLDVATRAGSRPSQAAAWLFLGKAYRRDQRLDEAIDALGRCVELIAPEARPMVRALLAEVLRARGDVAAALAEYRTARAELGPDADLHAQLACVREIAALEMQLGQRGAAIAALEEARDIARALRHEELAEIERLLGEWRAITP